MDLIKENGRSAMNQIHDYNKLCDKIKNLDSKIRFAGVINERGRLVAGGDGLIDDDEVVQVSAFGRYN